MAKKRVTQNSETALVEQDIQEKPAARKTKRSKAESDETVQTVSADDGADGASSVSENGAGQTAATKALKADPDAAVASLEKPDNAQAESFFDRLMKDKVRYTSSTPEDQQYLLFNMMNERLYWRIIYYMRRFPERLTSNGPTYSDRCIGGEELMAMMGYNPPEPFAAQWLDHHRVPPLDVAAQHIFLLNAQINAYLDVESACPIASIQRHFALSNDELEILATLVAAMSENDSVTRVV